jgi:hypothetical protein
LRRGFIPGEHLVRDDESGAVYYASEMVKRWDGALVHQKNDERRHPQEFVRAGTDPKALRDVRTDLPYPEAPAADFDLFVGETNVPTPQGAASHLFDVGIGSAAIGSTFVVR